MENNKRTLIISDATLRDGNHALAHQLSLQQISSYAKAIDHCGINIVEVGHGNGLGASSLQLGISSHNDRQLLRTARKALTKTKLGIHIIPGFGQIKKHLQTAIDEGVDVFRVAAHCTEADITQRHIEYAAKHKKTVHGVLMMSHMADKETLLQEVKKMHNYGAEAVILMDSAGAYLPQDVAEKIDFLITHCDIPIGFHAHNNLGLAMANSLVAIISGATIIDGTAKGFGAGAGNTPLEVLVAVLQKQGYCQSIDLYRLLDTVELAEKNMMKSLPHISALSLISGLHGVFSGFAKPVLRAAEHYQVDAREIFRILGEQNVIAGQEDQIIATARTLAEQT